MAGTCIMTVTLHQQGIYDINPIQYFDYKRDVEEFLHTIRNTTKTLVKIMVKIFL